jgi:hypothetical protein
MATTVSQAGSLQNVLNSPQYAQELQDYYLSTYAPGLTEATFGINSARNAFQANEVNRAAQRGEAVRRIAGDYASRGLRSPGAINEDRSAVQNEFAGLTREEQNNIAALESQRDVQFGTGAQSGETFINNPTLFGSIGAGARRAALANLQSLPELYNLLGLGASTAPTTPAKGGSKGKSSSKSKTKTTTPVTIASLLPQAPAAPRATFTPKKTPSPAPKKNTRTAGSGINRRYAI